MSRSRGDSTRFTATGIWAKPGTKASTLQFSDPVPKNETPQQKVKRLREAANRAKMAQVTKWDVMYMFGRMGVDAIHKFTVYGVVFATGCISVVAVFSIGDMIVYNRRKRSMHFETQELEQARILQAARDAIAAGRATPAQIALVEGIREEEEAMAKTKAERKIGSRLLWWLHGDWKEEKALSEQRKLATEELKKEQAGLGITQAVKEAVQDSRANSSSSEQPSGGPLDQLAANATSATEKPGKGWWGFGGSKKSE